MMKSLILSLLLPGVLLPAAAQTTAPDTLVQVDEARRVVLTATDSLAELTIEAAGATPLTFIITVWTVPRPPSARSASRPTVGTSACRCAVAAAIAGGTLT